jgi:hypothetical protein
MESNFMINIVCTDDGKEAQDLSSLIVLDAKRIKAMQDCSVDKLHTIDCEIASIKGNDLPTIENVVRSVRDKKLADSDWTQVADAPVDKAVWATYRQALRDITAQSGFPWTITWPDAP